MLDLSSPVVVCGHSGRAGRLGHTEHPLCLRCLCHTGQLSLGVPVLSLSESKVVVQFGACLWHVELDVTIPFSVCLQSSEDPALIRAVFSYP